eukprot:350149-Chlamydomonas_euryale.AAC.1
MRHRQGPARAAQCWRRGHMDVRRATIARSHVCARPSFHELPPVACFACTRAPHRHASRDAQAQLGRPIGRLALPARLQTKRGHSAPHWFMT